ncbi:O-antigen ligase family protein [Tahibacter harae]|uniref:O-antigen ligase-related domain-containing protein n=1 Tax=Tahibacter harae TaxID=2963937 RepID=A0ABT1QRR0_9GAMM|nr:O-antigen ligase family protein [Tahibacter harae]MCQ4164937.1 hypothetical protein [Tahibacter harae]
MAGLRGAGLASAAGLAGFLALQGADVTLGPAWACLVLATALALWRDRIDLSRAPDALEWSLLAFLAVAAVASLAGLDPRRSLALSVPVLAAVPLWFLLVRGDAWPALARWIAPALGLAAAAQIALLAFAAWRQPGGEPAAWVRDSGAAWLVVPNDLAWTACLLPFVRAAAPRWLGPPAAAVLLALALWLHSLTLLGAVLLALAAQELLRRGVRLFALPLLLATVAAALLALMAAATLLPSMLARLQLWQAALHVFAEHPLGVGLHNFVLAYRESSAVPAAALVDPRLTPWPHSLALEVLAELGAAGLAALLALAETMRRRALRLCCEEQPLACATAAALLVFVLLAITELSFLRLWVWTLGALLLGLLARQTAVSTTYQGRQ